MQIQTEPCGKKNNTAGSVTSQVDQDLVTSSDARAHWWNYRKQLRLQVWEIELRFCNKETRVALPPHPLVSGTKTRHFSMVLRSPRVVISLGPRFGLRKTVFLFFTGSKCDSWSMGRRMGRPAKPYKKRGWSIARIHFWYSWRCVSNLSQVGRVRAIKCHQPFGTMSPYVKSSKCNQFVLVAPANKRSSVFGGIESVSCFAFEIRQQSMMPTPQQ